jgi:hypothetical protein
MRIRRKACARCLQETEVLFRVRHSLLEDWVYQYGGTWKAQKSR